MIPIIGSTGMIRITAATAIHDIPVTIRRGLTTRIRRTPGIAGTTAILAADFQ